MSVLTQKASGGKPEAFVFQNRQYPTLQRNCYQLIVSVLEELSNEFLKLQNLYFICLIMKLVYFAFFEQTQKAPFQLRNEAFVI